jgi:hypothetical protein
MIILKSQKNFLTNRLPFDPKNDPKCLCMNTSGGDGSGSGSGSGGPYPSKIVNGQMFYLVGNEWVAGGATSQLAEVTVFGSKPVPFSSVDNVGTGIIHMSSPDNEPSFSGVAQQQWGLGTGEGSLVGKWQPGMVWIPSLDFGNPILFIGLFWALPPGESLPGIEQLGEIHIHSNSKSGPDLNEDGDPFGTGRNQRVWLHGSFWYIDIDSLGHVIDTVKDEGSGGGDTSQTIRH